MSTLAQLRSVAALFLRGNRRNLLFGAALSLTTALAGIALLGLSGWFITATAIAGASAATALAFDVFMPSAGIRLLAIGRTASRYGERLATHDATLRVLARLREDLFRGWATPDTARSLSMQPSRLLFRLTMDVDALDSLYLRLVVPVLASAGAAVAVAVALAFVQPALGLVVGVVLLAGGLGIPLVAAMRAKGVARRRARALESLRSRAIDLVRGQVDLAMSNRLGAHLRLMAATDQSLATADRELNRIESDAGLGLGILGAAILASVLVAVAFLAERGTIGAPVATFAVLLALAGLEPFGALRRGAVEFGRTLLAAQRLGPRLAEPPHTDTRQTVEDDDLAFRIDNAEVRLSGVSRPILQNVSLTADLGEHIAIIGPSGAGKSTLLSLLAGELSPACGKVATRKVGLLTQRTELFRDSLRGNLLTANPSANDTMMLDALNSAGLGSLVTSLPRGLDTMLGEGGTGLSAGQARRLALARLFLRDAPIWLLDEPTEGVDGDTARDVIERIGARASGRTVVIATHIRREAEIANRLIELKAGRVEADRKQDSVEYGVLVNRLRPD